MALSPNLDEINRNAHSGNAVFGNTRLETIKTWSVILNTSTIILSNTVWWLLQKIGNTPVFIVTFEPDYMTRCGGPRVIFPSIHKWAMNKEISPWCSPVGWVERFWKVGCCLRTHLFDMWLYAISSVGWVERLWKWVLTFQPVWTWYVIYTIRDVEKSNAFSSWRHLRWVSLYLPIWNVNWKVALFFRRNRF